MSEIKSIIKALELATTPLPEDRQTVLDAYSAISNLQDKMAKVRAALVMASMGYAENIQQNADEAIDIIDSINGR